MIYKLSRTPGTIRRAAPKTGADTAEILLEIGYSDTVIDELNTEISSI